MFYFSTIFYSFLFTNVKFCSIKKRKYILTRIRIPPDLLFANPLTPRSDKHVFSPYIYPHIRQQIGNGNN